jgi:prefoldin subunit 5
MMTQHDQMLEQVTELMQQWESLSRQSASLQQQIDELRTRIELILNDPPASPQPDHPEYEFQQPTPFH